jgi:acylglycerol lipase
MSTSTTTAADGTTLLVRHWLPAATPWAWMLLGHGIGEHSGRYERTGGIFADAGIAVTAFDLRGHGGSGGPRGDVERWADHLDDVGGQLAAVRTTAEGGPVVLMGHSMGGLIALDAVLSGRATPDLLVLSSPAIEDGLPRWQHLLAPMAARVVPGLRFPNAWGPEALSRDPEVGRRVAADPGCLTRASVRLGAHGFAAQARVQAGLGSLTTPTLVTHGDADTLIPPRATERLGTLPGVTRTLYPGLRHETLNEPEGPQVAADMVAWLRSSVAVLPTPQG